MSGVEGLMTPALGQLQSPVWLIVAPLLLVAATMIGAFVAKKVRQAR